MREFYVTYDLEKDEARHVLPEGCLCSSELTGKTFPEALRYLNELSGKMSDKWVNKDQWVQGEYIRQDGSRKFANREIRFTKLVIGWEQIPYEDQWDTCLIGIRPITDDERKGLEAEKKTQLQYRRLQYEQLKAEFEADS